MLLGREKHTLVGSNASNLLNTRPLYLNVNNDSGLSNVNVGSRNLVK